MAKRSHNRAVGEHNALALIFLVTFGALTLVALWLIYQQFAQVFTRSGRCTVLDVQTHREAVDQSNPTGASLYTISFTVELVTADGQRLRVPGYYTSTNYTASDQNTIRQIQQTYAVGKTAACSYTYLNPAGSEAIFQPAVPLEGFLFPGFFLVIALVVSIISLVALRRGPPPEIPFPDESASDAPVEPTVPAPEPEPEPEKPARQT